MTHRAQHAAPPLAHASDLPTDPCTEADDHPASSSARNPVPPHARHWRFTQPGFMQQLLPCGPATRLPQQRSSPSKPPSQSQVAMAGESADRASDRDAVGAISPLRRGLCGLSHDRPAGRRSSASPPGEPASAPPPHGRLLSPGRAAGGALGVGWRRPFVSAAIPPRTSDHHLHLRLPRRLPGDEPVPHGQPSVHVRPLVALLHVGKRPEVERSQRHQRRRRGAPHRRHASAR